MTEQQLAQKKLPYSSTMESVLYVFNIVFSNFDLNAFSLGNGSQKYVLLFLFWSSVITMNIYLLNMLIAIMSNTFNERTSVADQIRTREHLNFVLDNWYLSNFIFRNDYQNNLRYVVTAFFKDSSIQENQDLIMLKKEIQGIQKQFDKER